MVEGIDRSDILVGDTVRDDPAVRAAIAETEVIAQTRDWLIQQGIDAAGFERTGKSILTASTTLARSKTVIIIKHLPPDVELDSLRFMFTRNGETLTKFLVSPSKTVAIAQFADEGSAKRSFNANAFRKYKAVPLYLEWAPENLLTKNTSDDHNARQEDAHQDDAHKEDAQEDTPIIEKSAARHSQPIIGNKLSEVMADSTRLCVRNVAFEATSKDIRKLFSAYARVVAVRLPTKVASAGDASTGIRKQHRGFAFVEFASQAEMRKAFDALRDTHLYGRKLVLEPAAAEDGSVEAARLKAQRQGEQSESKRRKIDALIEQNDEGEDNAFEDLLM